MPAFTKTVLPPSVPILSISNYYQPPATHSRHSVVVSRSFGVCSRFPGGDVGMGAAASVRIMMILTTLGGAAPRPRNPAPCVCDARLLDIDKTRVLSNRDGGVSTPHPQGARCAIHAWRPASCRTFPFFSQFGYCGRGPPPPQRLSAHSRGSARHHLII